MFQRQCLVGPGVCLARIWYVNPDGSGDAIDIYGGFALASWGDTVLVAAGTYGGANMKNGVTLMSEDGPDHHLKRALGRPPVLRAITGKQFFKNLFEAGLFCIDPFHFNHEKAIQISGGFSPAYGQGAPVVYRKTASKNPYS